MQRFHFAINDASDRNERQQLMEFSLAIYLKEEKKINKVKQSQQQSNNNIIENAPSMD